MNDLPAQDVREPISARLKLRGDLVIRPDLSCDRPGYTIEDPLRAKFFRVGMAEHTFLMQLDGQMSIAEALGTTAAKLGAEAFNEHDALALSHWAMQSQLVQPLGGDGTARIAAAAVRNERQQVLATANVLCVRIPLVNPDRWLAKVAPWCDWIFSLPAAGVWSCALGYAIYLVAAGALRFDAAASVILNRDNWICLAAAWLLLKLLHETAHGLACKRFGGTVGSAGVMLLFFMPLAYVDVTSSWRFPCKWQRIATAAAGIYVELFVASLAVFVWTSAPPGVVQSMALNIAVTAGLSTLLFNANPLVRFDGYFILSDLLAIPNLASCGQKWGAEALPARLLGHDTPSPSRSSVKARIIRLYAIAALAWRAVFVLTFAIALIGMFGHLGMVLAVFLLVFAWGVPAVRSIRHLSQMAAARPINLRCAAVTWSLTAVVFVVLGAMLARPGRIAAPAVVEYAQLNIVRASSPGFVEKILVASGDEVVPGQPIAVLRNDELTAELADLELAYSESLIKSRMLIQSQEVAKLQMEAADRAAIEKRIAESKARVAALTVRAAVRGRIYARNLGALRERYLQAGDEIAIIGRDDAKELLVAVPQDDVPLFERHLGSSEVCVRTTSGECIAARLTGIDPRGSTELPHAALSAAVGGPLAVTFTAKTEESGTSGEQQCEVISPIFQGKVELTAEDGRRLYAGQLASVSFYSDDQSIAVRIYRSAQRWIERILHASRTVG